jgi:penicillin-insensitive murein endopeptidase
MANHKMPLKRKDFIYAALLTLLFIALTKILPYWLIHNKIAYEDSLIQLKSILFARMLSWPISKPFSSLWISSYYYIPIVFLYYVFLLILFRWIHTFMIQHKLYRWLALCIFLPIAILYLKPNLLLFLENTKPSQSIGTPGKGTLLNGKRLPYEGPNFRYFNFLSYIKGHCYVHEQVKQTLLDAYKTCEKTCPGVLFYTGEGSKPDGGPYAFNHRTHQNGTSIDLAMVFQKNDQPYYPLGLFNAYGYGLNTDNKGIINHSKPINIYPENTVIDFETNAKFLLALDDACRENKTRIKIIIMKVELKPLLFASPSGKKLLARNLRFANILPPMLNNAHDDHFHIDFEIDS